MADVLDMAGLGALAGVIAALSVFFLLIFIAVYIYCALALMAIAKKTKTENAWLAWIPIANVYLMTQIAEVPEWVTLAVLLPIIPVIGGLALAAVMVWLWWNISENLGKPGWYGILIIIPIANLVIMGILAWGD